MKTLADNLRGVLVILALVVCTLLGFVPLLPTALVKLLSPWTAIRRPATFAVLAVARNWARACNAAILGISGTRVVYDQQLADDPGGRYVLISNHQCWADVMLLVHILDRRLPFPRFFIKEPLRWLPVVGLACWALDYPFMKRHSAAAIKADPKLRDEDMKTVRRACAIFRHWPVTIINYAEGTRSTAAKRAAVNSPYRALLPPKAGGTAFAVNAMRELLDGVLDMSVAYVNTPEPKFWDVLCGRIERVAVRVRLLDVPDELLRGDYTADPAYREAFKRWLGGLWQAKDAEVDAIQDPRRPATRFS